jgi:hypothetical protein
VLSKSFREFSGIYSHFSLSYFYLLEGSKIFFLISKHFIWIAQVQKCLWEFSWNFWDFLTIFRASKYFLDFFWHYLCTGKWFQKKNNKFYLTGSSPKARPSLPPPAAGPAAAHAEPIGAQPATESGDATAGQAATVLACVPRTPGLALAPYKAEVAAHASPPAPVPRCPAQSPAPPDHTEPASSPTRRVDLRIPGSSIRLPPRGEPPIVFVSTSSFDFVPQSSP